MAKAYHVGRARRLVNAAMSPLARIGLAGRHTYNLTVRGRKTGRAYSVPVILIEGGERWLVAPYGEVGWVRNARAAAEVELSRAGRSERVRIDQVVPERAAPILRRYLKAVPSCARSSTSRPTHPSRTSSPKHPATPSFA
ncbi:MAG: nitroreductase/quinone reductase family protein [Solirubrobacteraceae bacterium]|jgi:deazaflavin-dependent oxidoreductase (nitroreductase family)